jgi:hypothetical protein
MDGKKRLRDSQVALSTLVLEFTVAEKFAPQDLPNEERDLGIRIHFARNGEGFARSVCHACALDFAGGFVHLAWLAAVSSHSGETATFPSIQ